MQDLLDTHAPNYMCVFLDVPDSPGSVRLSAIKSRALEISWSRPHDGNSPILNYIIEYSNLPGNVFLAQLTDPSNTYKYPIFSLLFRIADRRDQGDRQRRKMTAPGDATSLVIQNLRPGKIRKMYLHFPSNTSVAKITY